MNMNDYTYLAHHGIEGQKWGIRNGPPYPLDYYDHSAAEKRENSKSSLSKYKNNNDTSKTKSRDTEKERSKKTAKIIAGVAIGAVAVGTAALIYYKNKNSVDALINQVLFKNADLVGSNSEELSEYSLEKVKQFDNAEKILNPYANELYQGYLKDPQYSSVSKLPKLEDGYDPLDFSNIFDAHDIVNRDFSYSEDNAGSTQNCMFCTTAMVMRMKGYDVAANKTPLGFSSDMITEWFPDAEVKRPLRLKESSVEKIMANEGDGAYGNIIVTWANGSGSHSMFWYNKNNQTRVLDTQTGDMYFSLSEVLEKTDILLTKYARLDNCKPSDSVVGCLVSTENPKYRTDNLTDEAMKKMTEDITSLVTNGGN